MFALGGAVVVFMLVAQLGIALWMREVSVNGVADAVDSVMTSSAATAEAWVADYTDAVEVMASGTSRWIETESPDRDAVASGILTSAILNEHFTTMVVAYPDGSWTAVQTGGPQDDYAFAVAESSESGTGVSQTATLYDDELNLLDAVTLDGGDVPLEPSFWEAAQDATAELWFVSDTVDATKDDGVWVAEPARDADGELIAVVAAAFPVEALSDALSSLSLGDSGYAAIMDADRRVVAAPPETLTGDGAAPPEEPTEWSGTGVAPRATAESLGLGTSDEADPTERSVQLGYDGDLHVAEVGLQSVGVPWILQLRAVDDEIAPQIMTLRTTIRIASVAEFTVLLIGAGLFFAYWRPMRQIREKAFTDGLTGLLRRSRFLELAPAAIASAHRAGRAVAVVVLDLDNFKRINDEGGHGAGDIALTEVASTLQDVVRRGDLVSRWGGDEFVALLTLPDHFSGLTVAERLRSECESAFRASFPADLGLGATAGVVVSRAVDDDVVDLIQAADALLVEGKQRAKSHSYAGAL